MQYLPHGRGYFRARHTQPEVWACTWLPDTLAGSLIRLTPLCGLQQLCGVNQGIVRTAESGFGDPLVPPAETFGETSLNPSGFPRFT